MQKILMTVIIAAIACATALTANHSHAQDITRIPSTPSVTIYSLDDPAQPVTYNTRTPDIDPNMRQFGITTTPVMLTADTNTVGPNAGTAIADLPDTGFWGANWSGRANIGASLQTGNTEQDAINADAEVKAKWPDANGDTKHRASAKAEFNRENEDDDKTEDNRALKFAYDYFFSKKWFLNTSLGFEQDDIDQLDLRTDAGLGLGHQPFQSDDLNLQYILGPSYLREEFENGDTEDSLAYRWSLDYDQKIFDDLFQIFHNHELFVPSDETDAYLLDTKTGVRVPLRKGLVATAEVEFDRDNAPEPGVEKDDTTYALKLGYEW